MFTRCITGSNKAGLNLFSAKFGMHNAELIAHGIKTGLAYEAKTFIKGWATKCLTVLFAVILLACGIPASAMADDGDQTNGVKQVGEQQAVGDVLVSAEGDSAYIDGSSFAIDEFSRAQKGSNREIDGEYIGYNYYQGSEDNYAVAVVYADHVIAYIPAKMHALCDVADAKSCDQLKKYLTALDEVALSGGVTIGADSRWEFTSQTEYIENDIAYSFDVKVEDDYYVTVKGTDESDVVSDDPSGATRPSYVLFGRIVSPDQVDIAPAATGLAEFAEFLSGIDMSPLWVTLKTTGTAIVIIFILGLAAAYFTMRIPKRAQDIFDTIFTIPMVLPPTVCGFLLLLLLGRNTALGQWFIDIGFPLIFSWPATVIAATVVAFPLMYRNSRGAFENLDPNMMDAARTLGWSNAKIFFKLMIPLSWSSIAAATVLAFARALGEFGATLFLAGNYVGITRTIPIAIYFEWMSGNMDVAIFWTVIILIFSFIVILFINLWGRRTTKYRRRDNVAD